MDTERLKKFLKEKGIPVSGLKHELITKVNNSIQIEALGSDLDVKCFQRLVGAKSCPKSVRIWCASTYLRKPGGYTKIFQTGVRLCQCGHVCILYQNDFGITKL